MQGFQLTHMRTSILLCVLALFITLSQGIFLSHYIVTEGGFSSSNVPSQAFFYNDVLYVIVSVQGATKLNQFAYINQYDSNGQVTNILNFPIQCTNTTECDIRLRYSNLQDNYLYVLIEADICCNAIAHYDVYKVDLESFQIDTTQSVPPPNAYKAVPQSWLPFNSDLMYLSRFNVSKEQDLDSFNLFNLTPIAQYTTSMKRIAFGGANAPLVEDNKLLVSGIAGVSGPNSILYQVLDLDTLQVVNQTNTFSQSRLCVFVGDSSLFVLADYYGLALVDINNMPESIVFTKEYTGIVSYPTGVLADLNSNVFLTTREYNPNVSNYNSTIDQLQVVNTNGVNKLVLYDVLSVPSAYAAYVSGSNILSMGVNADAQQIAVLLESNQSLPGAVLVATYDNTHRPPSPSVTPSPTHTPAPTRTPSRSPSAF